MAFLILHNGLTGIFSIYYAVRNLVREKEARVNEYVGTESNKMCLFDVSY